MMLVIRETSFGFHETWIHQHKDDSKKLLYQNYCKEFTFAYIVNNYQDNVKAQKAVLLAW